MFNVLAAVLWTVSRLLFGIQSLDSVSTVMKYIYRPSPNISRVKVRMREEVTCTAAFYLQRPLCSFVLLAANLCRPWRGHGILIFLLICNCSSPVKTDPVPSPSLSPSSPTAKTETHPSSNVIVENPQLASDSITGHFNLSYRGFTNISRQDLQLFLSSSFISPGEVFYLDLSHNALQTIDDNTFVDIGAGLIVLDLSYNRLAHLRPGSLRGLHALQDLRLDHNQLRMTRDSGSFPAGGVFVPVRQTLTRLTLHANRNQDGGGGGGNEAIYDDAIFQNLTLLRELTIMTFSRVMFGPGFSGMRSLGVLDLHNDCMLHCLTNDTFRGLRHVPSLTKLDMSSCPLYHVDVCAFCGLSSLTWLSIGGHKGLGLPTALTSLYGLAGRVMTYLDLSNVQFYPVSLGKAELSHLHAVCVSTVLLRKNFIYGITKSAIEVEGSRFLECAEHVDLSNNVLQRWSAGAMIMLIAKATRLKTLQLQQQYVYALMEAACLLGTEEGCKPSASHRSNSSVSFCLSFRLSACLFACLSASVCEFQ